MYRVPKAPTDADDADAASIGVDEAALNGSNATNDGIGSVMAVLSNLTASPSAGGSVDLERLERSLNLAALAAAILVAAIFVPLVITVYNSFLLPLVMHLLAVCFIATGQDLPDGNYGALEKKGVKQSEWRCNMWRWCCRPSHALHDYDGGIA